MIVSDYKTGGAGSVALKTSEILSSHGYIINYIWGIDHFKFSIFNYLCNVKAYKLLMKELSNHRPDIIMIHNIDNILSPLVLLAIKNYKKNYNVKVIFTVHDYHIISPINSLSYYSGVHKCFFNEPPTILSMLTKKLDRRGYLYGLIRLLQWYPYYRFIGLRNIIDYFICPSEFMASKVENHFPEEKVKLIKNPVKFNAAMSDITNDNIIRITFTGRLTQDKGIYPFLKSLASINSEKKIIINLIGDGEHKDKIENINIPSWLKINLFGKRDSNFVKDTLLASDYVLLPSLCYENAPLTLVEGVFLGCKIITMNYGGMREIAIKFNDSVLLDDLSPSSIYHMIEKINKKKPCCQVERQSFFDDYSESNYINKLSPLIMS